MVANGGLGIALRSLRRRLNLTLKEVADRTGISASSLSKVERNYLSLTYEKLVQLSGALDVDVTVLFGRHHGMGNFSVLGRRSINRRNDGHILDTPNYCHIILSADIARKSFTPLFIDIKTKSIDEFGPMLRHAGEEFAVVMQGAVAVHTEYYAPVTLKTGESIYLDSDMAHAYIAQGEEPCRLLLICSGSHAGLIEGGWLGGSDLMSGSGLEYGAKPAPRCTQSSGSTKTRRS